MFVYVSGKGKRSRVFTGNTRNIIYGRSLRATQTELSYNISVAAVNLRDGWNRSYSSIQLTFCQCGSSVFGLHFPGILRCQNTCFLLLCFWTALLPAYCPISIIGLYILGFNKNVNMFYSINMKVHMCWFIMLKCSAFDHNTIIFIPVIFNQPHWSSSAADWWTLNKVSIISKKINVVDQKLQVWKLLCCDQKLNFSK